MPNDARVLSLAGFDYEPELTAALAEVDEPDHVATPAELRASLLSPPTLRLRREWVSEGALLTLDHAIELIPVGTRSERRRWLTEHQLVRHLFGRPVVAWRAVLQALDETGGKPEPKARTTRLPRRPL